MSENIEPGTREEMYLDAINSQLDGEAVDTEHMIEPGSRKERYLSEIAKKIASTIELPAVTSADNGDVLTVKNGKWDKGDAPSGALVATFSKSGNNIVCDKTIAELVTAADAGTPVFALIPSSITSTNHIGGGKALVPMTGYATLGTKRATFSFVSYYYEDGLTPAAQYICSLQGGTVLLADVWSYAERHIALPPLTVTYTITGEAVNGVYPLSSSHTLEEIAFAVSAGREIRAYIVIDNRPFTVPFCVRSASNGVVVATLLGIMPNIGPALGQIDQYTGGDAEVSRIMIVPLSAAQFEYSSGSLYITDPLA